MADAQAWVGCLACYNAGRLVGEWVPGTEAADFTPCRRPGHEEWWVFDHEGFEGLLSGECSPFEATRLADAIDAIEADHYPIPAVKEWLEDRGESLSEWDDVSDQFTEAYAGVWESEADFAEDYAESVGLVKDSDELHSYIDWERFARDLFIDAYWSADAESGVYVFHRI